MTIELRCESFCNIIMFHRRTKRHTFFLSMSRKPSWQQTKDGLVTLLWNGRLSFYLKQSKGYHRTYILHHLSFFDNRIFPESVHMKVRSSHSQVLYEKAVPKTPAKFSVKHLCRSLFLDRRGSAPGQLYL